MSASWCVRSHHLPLDAASAESLFLHLYGGRAVAVWLDSARRASGTGRWSIMGAPELPRDDVLAVHGAAVWPLLAERMDQAVPVCGLPFAGGYVGTIGYGAKAIGTAAPGDGPDAQLVHLSRFLAIDHEAGRVHVVAVGPESEAAGAASWIDRTVERVRAAAPVADPPPLLAAGAAGSTIDRDGYLADLAAVRSWLEAGDSYEACYTYLLRFAAAEPSLDAYRRLRRMNPAPFGAYLRLPGGDVLSSSPERYLSVTASGDAETKPIKGTAARSSDPVTDEEAARALAADPKARAENLMIVDLLRNDLGRICEPGSVSVPTLFGVESYQTVHQLVTTVRGRLRPDVGAVGAAAALFPPGSMTGAPKRRTVELLDRLERSRRGAYAGVLGYFSRDGAAELAVTIRTAVVSGGTVAIGTGGAITIDSDPLAELEETVVKAAPLLAAFGRGHPLA